MNHPVPINNHLNSRNSFMFLFIFIHLLHVQIASSSSIHSNLPHMVKIPSGEFVQGYTNTPIPANLSNAAELFPNGDYDEQPYHTSRIQKSFYVSAFEVTNLEFEQFQPEHYSYRNTLNFSKNDDDAVLFVSWYDAVNYCKWLTKTYGEKNGMKYRLLTETEWEWSSRANTTTLFWTGNTIPNEMHNHNDCNNGMPHPGEITPTKVGRFQPNPFGLYDTLGNVEEWVDDWYNMYEADGSSSRKSQQQLKVTRGGSHGTELYYLRSANRQAAVPTEKNWFIGFRIAADKIIEQTNIHEIDHYKNNDTSSMIVVVEEEEERVTLHANELRMKDKVSSSWPSYNKHNGNMNDMKVPILKPYVNIPMPAGNSRLPFIKHNHDPTITACKMYDRATKQVIDRGLIASWFSTNCGEAGRCAGIAYSQLLPNANKWTIAKKDLNLADRTQCCPAYFYDRDTYRLYQFSAACAAGDWSGFYSDLAGLLRYSDDCGETWADVQIIWPKHGVEHQIVVTIIKSHFTNQLLIPVDHWGIPPYIELGDQTLVQHNDYINMSSLFNSKQWYRSPSKSGTKGYNNTGGHHSSIVELKNQSYLTVGRGHPQTCTLFSKDGCMPISISNDGAFNWIGPNPSPFPAIHGGQREVMIRLGSIDQPIMLCSFANSGMKVPCGDDDNDTAAMTTSMEITGLFCSISLTEGDSWEYTRSITTDLTAKGHSVSGFDGAKFKMSYNSSEPNGYMDATIDDDGYIHLITSMNHYQFNLEYMMMLPNCNPTL